MSRIVNIMSLLGVGSEYKRGKHIESENCAWRCFSDFIMNPCELSSSWG